jgi:hypothetical protein
VGGPTEPREIAEAVGDGHSAARTYYTCDEPHDVPHADWWVDWRDGEILERIRMWPAPVIVGSTLEGASRALQHTLLDLLEEAERLHNRCRFVD